MSLQLLGLLIVCIGFTGLVAWVYWPTNHERFDAGSLLPFAPESDADEEGTAR